MCIYYLFIFIAITCMILNSISDFTDDNISASSLAVNNSKRISTLAPVSTLLTDNSSYFTMHNTNNITESFTTTKSIKSKKAKNPLGGTSNSIYGGNPFSTTWLSDTNSKILLFLDLVSFLILGIEFIFRTIIHPNKIKMLFDPLYFLDIIAIWPYFIFLIDSSSSHTQGMYYIFNIFRVFLLIKFFRHMEFLQMLSLTVVKSYKEMLIYFTYVGFGVLIFSSFIYFIESTDNGSCSSSSSCFYSIPGILFN